MREHQIRRCIVCKRSGAKEELLRFVSHEAGLVWDQQHSHPGRGAYVHRALDCWGRMLERNRWEHAFRGKVRIEEANLRSLQQAVRGEISELQLEAQSPRSGGGAKKLRL